jgi:acyl dehydratase
MSFYWEDIEIGFNEAFGPYGVDRDEVIAFAQRYDPQPFHLDDAAAADTHFGRLAASGWHTCSMTMAAMVKRWNEVPGWQENALGAMGLDELRWRKAVFPGDRLRGTSELIEKIESRSRPEMGIMKWRTRVLNQDGEEVLSMTSVSMRRRRPIAG